jgi:hypothetical protein
MGRQRKLTLEVVQVDIYAPNGEVVATCTRYANGSWGIQDREKKWFEDVAGPVEMKDLLAAYIDVRRRRNSIRKVLKENKPGPQTRGPG